jgi:BirA family biotin operon repressor/biotin-[acetyl-CoA-carboxylase] ligase
VEFSTTKFFDHDIFHYQILDSTNNQAKILIDAAPLQSLNNQVIICDVQTSGRGRAGRDWISDEGNFFCSLIQSYPNKILQNNYKFFSFITALAIQKTILNICKDQKIIAEIKWPNDVLLNGKKISGILLEQHKNSLIIGVGINSVSHPSNVDSITGLQATNLFENNAQIMSDDLLKMFLQEFANYKKLFEVEGFAAIKKQYLQHAYNLNKNIKVRLGDNIFEGIFEDIDDEGNLLLKTNTGQLKINAGEVFGL